ncbi:hypothetical protein L2E82_31605 [Cichorium intybus]|uniref:Uncharacterized protein n=1 Tax=Cichorium intybus TaxID=13427 RepID=A0ACB9BF80_CICIN|nr:hypothetical protein L2E82_31605 [Cichorium intybus]
MHSLSLKLFVDFNDVKSTHATPSQVSFGAGEFPASLNFGDQRRRNCRIIARASERDGGAGAGAEAGGAESQSQQNKSSFFARGQTYALMKQQMELAAKSENFEESARLHDSLKSFFHYRNFRQTLSKLLCLKIMAEPEANPTNEPLVPRDGEEEHLKYLDFVQSAVIYFVVCFLTVYEYAKENVGPLKPGVQTVESIVKTVIGPVCERFHDVLYEGLKLILPKFSTVKKALNRFCTIPTHRLKFVFHENEARGSGKHYRRDCPYLDTAMYLLNLDNPFPIDHEGCKIITVVMKTYSSEYGFTLPVQMEYPADITKKSLFVNFKQKRTIVLLEFRVSVDIRRQEFDDITKSALLLTTTIPSGFICHLFYGFGLQVCPLSTGLAETKFCNLIEIDNSQGHLMVLISLEW